MKSATDVAKELLDPSPITIDLTSNQLQLDRLNMHRDGGGSREDPYFQLARTTMTLEGVRGELRAQLKSRQMRGSEFIVKMSGERSMKFSGYVTHFHTRSPIDGLSLTHVTVRVVGSIETLEPEKEKPVHLKKLKNKFYVAHPKIGTETDTWSKPTLEAAIAHAAELMEKEGRDDYFIVKIVKRVRKPKPKPIVENV